jgi:hypothetical protein
MRPKRTYLLLAILLGLSMIFSLPLLPQEAQAWRGGGGFHGGGFRGGFGGFHGGGFGGFHGGGGFDGGFGGGSFHQGSYGGGSWSGAHGGRAAWGPGGAGVAQGPGGTTVARGPYGGGAAETPGGSTATWHDSDYDSYNRNINVSQTYNVSGGGWGYYGGGAVAAGAIAGLAIGATIASLPAAAQPLDVGGQTYYYDGTNYYQPCFGGSDTNYCVVPNPNQ